MLCAAPAFHTDVDHQQAIGRDGRDDTPADRLRHDRREDGRISAHRARGRTELAGRPGSRHVTDCCGTGLAFKETPRWTLSTDEAIEGILAGRWSFYIQLGIYDVVDVQLATSPTGRAYLKTEADQDTPDELLFLPRCR
jgi:hypothetical protein